MKIISWKKLFKNQFWPFWGLTKSSISRFRIFFMSIVLWSKSEGICKFKKKLFLRYLWLKKQNFVCLFFKLNSYNVPDRQQCVQFRKSQSMLNHSTLGYSIEDVSGGGGFDPCRDRRIMQLLFSCYFSGLWPRLRGKYLLSNICQHAMWT